ncbi:MAG: orotate phosphoribosyltransferase-like protein [Candidatus Odinarchaeia archaeon]
MKNIEELIKKAKELKDKGLSTDEISDVLNVQYDTAVWLLVKGEKMTSKPTVQPRDVYVDWSPIGSSYVCLELIGEALANLIMEKIEENFFEEPDIIAGIDADGGPLAAIVSRELEKPMALIRARHYSNNKKGVEHSTVDANFASVKNKKVLLVDDVVTSGIRISQIAKSAEEYSMKIVGAAVIVDKKGDTLIDNIPIAYLIRIVPILG